MSQSYGNPTRTGIFFDFLNQNTDTGYDLNNPSITPSRYDPAASEIELVGNDISHGRSKSWGRGAQLPNFLSAFGTLVNGSPNSGLGVAQGESFFIPSYLRGSVYVKKLQELHKAKQISQKNSAPTHSSLPGSLSKSASSTNLNARMASSHRGMTYDLIEKAPPSEDEYIPPLPSKWNNYDKQAALEVLSDGLELKLNTHKPERDRDYESCAIRANHPMPSQCGLYYFEVSILARKREESSIGIGFSSKKVPLTRLPGWEPESWAYHGDDGDSYCSQISGKGYGPSFSAHDVIGCGVNFRTNSAFFTKNGINLGTAFRDIKGEFYPSVGMKKPGEHIRVNFGQSPFVFDIDGMMEREKALIEHEIEATSTEKLAPPLHETELTQALVLQFLKHDGYVETAREFAKEVHFEKKALSLDPEVVIPDFEVREDQDASHRQLIRTAILDGDIDTALKYTNSHFPRVLENNEKVYFRLRCRKFVEMIRQAAELQNCCSKNGEKKSLSDDWVDEMVNQQMEINEREYYLKNYDRMDINEREYYTKNYDQMEIENSPNSNSESATLLRETIKYGTELAGEYRDDTRIEFRKALEDAFALMAYSDPLRATGVAYLLDPSGRLAVAEELNSAILQSLGKSSSSALESLYQQTSVLLEDLRKCGGSAAAFLNIDEYSKPRMGMSSGR